MIYSDFQFWSLLSIVSIDYSSIKNWDFELLLEWIDYSSRFELGFVVDYWLNWWFIHSAFVFSSLLSIVCIDYSSSTISVWIKIPSISNYAVSIVCWFLIRQFLFWIWLKFLYLPIIVWIDYMIHSLWIIIIIDYKINHLWVY